MVLGAADGGDIGSVKPRGGSEARARAEMGEEGPKSLGETAEVGRMVPGGKDMIGGRRLLGYEAATAVKLRRRKRKG